MSWGVGEGRKQVEMQGRGGAGSARLVEPGLPEIGEGGGRSSPEALRGAERATVGKEDRKQRLL